MPRAELVTELIFLPLTESTWYAWRPGNWDNNTDRVSRDFWTLQWIGLGGVNGVTAVHNIPTLGNVLPRSHVRHLHWLFIGLSLTRLNRTIGIATKGLFTLLYFCA